MGVASFTIEYSQWLTLVKVKDSLSQLKAEDDSLEIGLFRQALEQAAGKCKQAQVIRHRLNKITKLWI